MRNLSAEERVVVLERIQKTQKRLPEALRDIRRYPDRAEVPSAQKTFESILRKHHAVGASMVLVYPDGNTGILSYGHARLHPKVPVQKDTCFRVASVTKLVSTFGILSLVEDGILELDAPVEEVLGFELRHPRYPDTVISLRMLLTHTAGIENAPLMPDGQVSVEKRFRDPAIWRDAEPGTSFLYTNLGAGLVGTIAERATGKRFQEIMQERIFGPLGICAGYGAHHIPDGRMVADGYAVHFPLPAVRKYDAAALAKNEDTVPEGESFTTTVGQLVTDPEGMAALIRLMIAQEDTPVLRLSSLEEMRSLQDGKGGIMRAGRGLNVAFLRDIFPGVSLIGHQGVAYGMCAEMFGDPEKGIGVGIMMNGVSLDHVALQGAGAELLTLGFAVLQG